MIPNNILQIHLGPKNTEYEYLMHLSKGWELAYPDWNVIIAEEDELERVLFEYSPRALDAYNKIDILTYRADLGRLALLYTYGGLYLDLDTRPNLPLSHLVRSDSMTEGFLVSFEPDRISEEHGFSGVVTNNHVAASEPNSKMVKHMLDVMIDRILLADISQSHTEGHRGFWIVPIVSTDAWGQLLVDYCNKIAKNNDFIGEIFERGWGSVGHLWIYFNNDEFGITKFREAVTHIGSLTLKDFVDTNAMLNPLEAIADLYRGLQINNVNIKVGSDGI